MDTNIVTMYANEKIARYEAQTLMSQIVMARNVDMIMYIVGLYASGFITTDEAMRSIANV